MDYLYGEGAAASSCPNFAFEPPVNALAYTVGHNVVFDENKYAPTTHAGRKLLAL